jgi:hypothetical protein
MQEPDPNPISRQDVFDIIEYALRQALPNVVQRNKNLNARILTEAALSHMELCGVLFSRKPPAPKHTSDHYMGDGTPRESASPKISTPELRRIAREAFEQALAQGYSHDAATGIAVGATVRAAPGWSATDALVHLRQFVLPYVSG